MLGLAAQVILKLLSEEIFDFSRGELTQAKTKELKSSLNSDFRLIHDLCLYVLNVEARPDLIRCEDNTLRISSASVCVVHILWTEHLFPWLPSHYTLFACSLHRCLLPLSPNWDKSGMC